jgi:hypothetical protein
VTIAIARGWQSAAPRPIFADMAIFPPTFGPRAALADLKAFLRQRSREQVIAACLAVLVTIIILIIFLVDSQINTAPPPQIVYIENYGPNRTDADIKADQKKASEERRKQEEARKREFQKLEKQFHIE